MSLKVPYIEALFLFLDLMVFIRPLLICFFLLILIFCPNSLSGQQQSSDSSLYREDQFYLGISMVFLTNSFPEFESSGLSRHFQWGFIRDIPLSANGTLAAGVGIGMGFNRYTSNLERFDERGKIYYSFLKGDENKSFFVSQSALELPITLRWRNSSATDFAFWRLYGGVSVQWFYLTQGKFNGTNINIKNDFENYGATAHLSVGYNTWNFYIGYRITPFFSEAIQDNSLISLDFVPLTLGLIFYIL